jgi:hypothetical protein
MSLDVPLLPRLDVEHPWLGLESFGESTRDYFFGRDAEAAELLQRLRLHPLLVLYGRSGLGKTSLLRAKLVPDLEKRGDRPAIYRISYRKGENSPLNQLAVVLGAGGRFNNAGFALPEDAPSRLWLHLHRRQQKDRVTHLILDQFEEIFSLGTEWPGADAEVRQALAILVQGAIPPPVETLIDEGEAFFKLFHLDVPPLPVLLSLRQDYFFALNRWRSHLPQLGQNNFELRELRGPAAFDAVFKPGELRCHYRGEVSESTKADTGLPPIVSKETAERIVRFAAKEKEGVPLQEIEAVPPILSLLCHELNLRRFPQPADADGRLTSQITFREGDTDVETIIATFYERCLVGRPEAVRIFIEEQLVSYSGARLQQDQRSILKAFADGCEIPGAADDRRAGGYGDSGAARACLDELVNQRLLTAIGGSENPSYELVHDLVAAVVEKSRAVREERFEKEQADRRAESERKAKNEAEAREKIERELRQEQEARAVEAERREQAEAQRAAEAERVQRLEAERAKEAEERRKEQVEAAQRLAEEQKQRAELSEQREKEEKESAIKLRRLAIVAGVAAVVALLLLVVSVFLCVLSVQRTRAIATASGISAYLDGLLAVSFEDKSNSVPIISSQFSKSLLDYLNSVERLLRPRILIAEDTQKIQKSRVIVNLLAGDREAALKECNRSLERQSQQPTMKSDLQTSLLLLRGDILDEEAVRTPLEQRDTRRSLWESAKASYQEAARRDPTDNILQSHIHVQLAQVYNSLARNGREEDFVKSNTEAVQELKTALGTLEELLSSNPSNVEALRIKGRALNKMGLFVKAPFELDLITEPIAKRKVVEDGIAQLMLAMDTRQRVFQISDHSEADATALVLTQANLADAYLSLALKLNYDTVRALDMARSFLDARIETCKELVKLDPRNLYIRALLRKGYFIKADFLIWIDRSERGKSEAMNLLSSALVLSPETIRDGELRYWRRDFESLGMLPQWETLSAGRAAFRHLSGEP